MTQCWAMTARMAPARTTSRKWSRLFCMPFSLVGSTCANSHADCRLRAPVHPRRMRGFSLPQAVRLGFVPGRGHAVLPAVFGEAELVARLDLRAAVQVDVPDHGAGHRFGVTELLDAAVERSAEEADAAG